jgi:hypothetical protein
MVMPATASRPEISSQGEPSFVESSADSVPNMATSANVRRPALADGGALALQTDKQTDGETGKELRQCFDAATLQKPVSIALPLCFLPVTNDKLQTLRAIVFIDAQAVHGKYLFGQWFVVSEQYRLNEFTF